MIINVQTAEAPNLTRWWILQTSVAYFCISTGWWNYLISCKLQINVVKSYVLARYKWAAHEIYRNWWSCSSSDVLVNDITDSHKRWLQNVWQKVSKKIRQFAYVLASIMLIAYVEQNLGWVRAVVLVYDYGVLHVIHDDIFEQYSWSSAWTWCGISLDSKAICCTN